MSTSGPSGPIVCLSGGLHLSQKILYVCGRVPWLYQYWPGGFMLFVVLCPGTPEGSTGSGSGFKASQKTGQRLKVSSDRLGEAGNRTCDPWFTRHRFIPYTTAASKCLSFCMLGYFSLFFIICRLFQNIQSTCI